MFTSHPKVPGALTNKTGQEPESSGSLGASTSKLPALATRLQPQNPACQRWGDLGAPTWGCWAALEPDRWATTGEEQGNKGKKVHFPSKCHRGSYTVMFPGIALTRQIQIFLQPLEKRAYSTWRRDCWEWKLKLSFISVNNRKTFPLLNLGKTTQKSAISVKSYMQTMFQNQLAFLGKFFSCSHWAFTDTRPFPGLCTHHHPLWAITSGFQNHLRLSRAERAFWKRQPELKVPGKPPVAPHSPKRNLHLLSRFYCQTSPHRDRKSYFLLLRCFKSFYFASRSLSGHDSRGGLAVRQIWS